MEKTVDTIWVVIAAKGAVVAQPPPEVWEAQHQPSGYVPLKPGHTFDGDELLVVCGNHDPHGAKDPIGDAAMLLGAADRVAYQLTGGDNPWPPPPPPPPMPSRNPWPPPPPPPHTNPNAFAETLLKSFELMLKPK